MIPKTIHYCWFGGKPLPLSAQKCIATWEKYCPDYKIMKWDETNFDINCNDYVREAYKSKKWAFVSDYARLLALVNYGGVYMDTDVELLKNIDCFLHNQAFSGFESSGQIPTGIMAAEKEQNLFVELLHDYDNKHFKRDDGSLDLTTNVERITKVCLSKGLKLNGNLQMVLGFVLYPKDYFCPKDSVTREIHITKNTVAIHHFDGSWSDNHTKLVKNLTELFGHKNTKAAIEIKHFIKKIVK